MASKKAAGGKTAAKKTGATKPCPDTPKPFFAEVNKWAKQFSKWANQVETCYGTGCGTPKRSAKLVELCHDFSKFAKDAKKWADPVEECYQENCTHGPDHVKPPPPPFDD